MFKFNDPYGALGALIGIVIIAAAGACAPAAVNGTNSLNGWTDLGGNLHSKVVDSHTTCYLYGSSTLSCVYHP